MRKYALVLMIALLLAGVTGAVATGLLAPTGTWNVTPQEKSFPTDRMCPEGSTLVADQFGAFGGSETYTIDGKAVTVEITYDTDTNIFDFVVIGGLMDRLFVQGGSSYLLYQYEPPVDGATNTGPVAYDTRLHNGYNPQGGNYQEVSHLDFCLIAKGEPLRAEKTAFTSYTRTYTWDITKEADTTYTGFIGDASFDHPYTVSVTQTIKESRFQVDGTITVYNDNAFEVEAMVTDWVDGVEATVDCDGGTNTLNVPANGSATCAYYASLETKTDGTNVATITSLNFRVDGTTAEQDYTFGEPTDVVGFPTINVTDDEYGYLGVANESAVFNYDGTFECSMDQADYVDGVWVMDNFVNTATIVETGQSDNATVKLTCYAPVIDKDAQASWEEKYDWEITKEADATYTGFIGDASFDHPYTVSVDQTVTQQNFLVSGTIFVANPAGSPGNMTVSMVDELAAGVFATVDCGDGATSITVAPGQTGTCSYSGYLADKVDGTNIATGTFNLIDFIATAGYTFGDPIIVGFPTVNVTDDKYADPGPVSESAVFNYNGTFECPTDPAVYVDGFWVMDNFVNTATIVETGQSDSATVALTCYAPVIDKDAQASWEEQYDWEITKKADGTYTRFIGDAAFLHPYTVSVNQTVTPQNFLVSGNINVANPAGSPGNMTVSVVDELADGVFATVDCGDGATSITVAPGQTGTCSYSGYLADKVDGTNIATGTFNLIDFTATADYAFGDPIIIGYPTVNVTDSFEGPLGEASGDKTFETYFKEFECPTDPAVYVDGVWLMNDFVNTATIVETGQYDSATVELNCYAPVITKDAEASYDQRHVWEVEKTVDPVSQGGVAGDTLSWTWTVTVSEEPVEENFLVSGSIVVANPAGSPGDMVVSLVDQLNDGTLATVDCGDGAISITVAPGTYETCSYTADPTGRTATLNTATGTFNSIDFTATAPVTFVVSVVKGTATVTDDEIGLNENLTAGEGPWVRDGNDSHTCSTDRADYFVDGVYKQFSDTITNNAEVVSNDELQDQDSATTTYTCDASFVDILKTTNGVIDPTKDIRFRLYDADGVDLNDEVSTLGVDDGMLEFQTALVPDAKYTICESPVPAGYTFEVRLNGQLVPTYAGPPGADDPTGEIQCFDFTAGAAGVTLEFSVNNSFPGGAPRTPGYWKNWNTCTGGNQAETAAALGGVEEGVFLLDDLLPQTLGDLVIEYCEHGVLILDRRDLDTGRNMSNDAAYTLAMALLAARLNQQAGACVPTGTYQVNGQWLTFEQILNRADKLLEDVGFDGTGNYLGPQNRKQADLRALALELYEIIDLYNNSQLCTGEPSH